MSETETFQIPIEAAERYEESFVPGFFAQWAPILCGAAGLTPGMSVLDVGCGTGIVARTAADVVGPAGKVTGIDLNEAMLTVARRVRPGLDWRRGDARTLSFDAGSFDVVLSQMMLMFIPERAAAIGEMARVANPGGSVGVLVPGELARQPAFAPLLEMAVRHAGAEAESLLSTYFVCGDAADLEALFERAGLTITVSRREVGRYGAESVDTAVRTEVESTPLVERISDDVYRRIREDARDVLAPFTGPDGVLDAPFECNVIVGQRR